MTTRPQVPRKSIYRLSVYSRCLRRLADKEVETVSSETLAKAAGVKPAQLRKDLTYLDQLEREAASLHSATTVGSSNTKPLGRRGLGYNVPSLTARIDALLGKAHLVPVILVGVGHLGSALLRYQGFAREGFEIVASFDIDPHRPRFLDSNVPLLPMEALAPYVQNNDVRLAILAVPAECGQEAANHLMSAGVQGILNFSGALLEVPDDVMVNNVNLAIELENLAYFVK